MKSIYFNLAAAVFLSAGALSAGDNYIFENILYSGSTSLRGLGRSAGYTDAVIHKHVTGTLKTPTEGDLAGTNYKDEEVFWSSIEMDEEGLFKSENLRSGWIYMSLNSKEKEVVIVQPNGASEIIVNGVLRAGDVYANGWTLLPVELKKGRNEFWYKVSRGRKKGVTVSKPEKPVFLTSLDTTLPDLLTTEMDEKWGAIRVVNASENTLSNFVIISNVAGKTSNTQIRVSVPPMTSRKIPFKLRDGPNSPTKQHAAEVSLYQDDKLLHQTAINLEVKEPTKNYRRTFISNIDGSLQYYGVRQGTAELGRKPAKFLSVHGAGVKGIGQAGSYQNKDWGHVVAPTNRREFGFDWEDWGRIDAMEAFEHAAQAYGTDPVRTYLTGHSMGGHGTWYLGATFPDIWAAIAPMAGWRSFFSYVGTPEFEEPSSMEAMMNRAANPSRTTEMSRNYLHHGVFIEHGDADSTVPVSEARAMRELLGTFHPSMGYHEEPGGGHWYGVDHQRAFDFFRDHEKTNIQDLDNLEFRISSPGINATCRYITLYQQEESYEFCGVVSKQTIRSRRQRRFEENITERTFDVTTENLSVFKIDLNHCKGMTSLSINVDGKPIDGLEWPGVAEVWLKKVDDAWKIIEEPADTSQKNPVRYGGFKDAFRHQMVFVYATGGNKEENAWAYNKARFDSETFYYRGNGAMDVIPDTEFKLDAYKDRSVIIYGNADTNKAWKLVLNDSPVQVKNGAMTVGSSILKGDDLGLYMVRPRLDSEVASIGVVAGTGEVGCRTVDSNRYFVAGTGYPDLLIITPEMYRNGISGVKAAGYFGNDWSVENGSIVWSE